MAFVLVGSGGTGVSSTSSSSFTLATTADLSLSNSRFCVLTVTTDNSSSTDGNNNEHTSVTGGTGTWTKIGEYTNANGAAGAGVTTSLWFFIPTGANASPVTFTINLAAAVVDKAAQIRRFTWDTTKGVRVEGTPNGYGVDASNGFGSSTLSGLPSQEYLFVAGLGKEANTTTALTPSAGFGTWSVVRSRNNAAAVASWGEHLISTATGATSNPTLAVSGDTAGVFAALEEYTASVTHDGSGALVGDIGSVSGTAARTAAAVSHDATGTLTGQLGSVSGSAARSSGAVTHDASGTLTAQIGGVSGAADRFRAFDASGVLSGQGSVLSGSSSRFRAFSATGTLTGPGSVIAGSSARFRAFGSSGVLAGQGAIIDGVAARSGAAAVHDATGGLAGAGSEIVGAAVLTAATVQNLHGRKPRYQRGRRVVFPDELDPVEETAVAVEVLAKPVVDVGPLVREAEGNRKAALAILAQIKQVKAERIEAARQAKLDTLRAEYADVAERLQQAIEAEQAYIRRLRDEDEFFLLAA